MFGRATIEICFLELNCPHATPTYKVFISAPLPYNFAYLYNIKAYQRVIKLGFLLQNNFNL